MRFSELTIPKEFDPRAIWKFHEKCPTVGLRWADMLLEKEAFQKKKSELKTALIDTISKPIEDAENDEEIGMKLDPVFEHLSKSLFCSNDINQDLLLKKANKNTLTKKLNDWCTQLALNVDVVKATPGISIFQNKFKNVPAVVICAGPSLGNNIEMLKTLKGKALIMSTDTAFRSLTKRGIDPEFVNAHDANEAGERFFKGIKTNALGTFVNYVHPKTIQSFEGPKLFYFVEDTGIAAYKLMALSCDDPSRLDGSFLKSGLTGGSSVAHTAMYLAIYFGCNPITFLGLDLSYPDLKRSHFETDNPKNVTDQKLIDVTNIQGHKVKTNLSFMSYKTVFEKMGPVVSWMTDTTLYTSTEDEHGEVTSVVHAALEPLKLKDFISRYCQSERKELSSIMEVYNSYVKSKT